MSEFDFRRRFADRAQAIATTATLFDGSRPVGRRVKVEVGAEALILTDERRTEWALGDLRIVRDETGEGTLSLTNSDRSPARLILSDPVTIRAVFEAVPDLGAARTRPRAIASVLGIGAVAAGCLAGLIFGVMPVLAERLAPMISPEAEVAFGQTMREQVFGRLMPTCTDPAGQAALETMTAQVSRDLDLPYPLQVSVVQSGELNAFAMPGGQIVILSGLIDAAESPNEVAAVLAHEIGHVVYRDVTRAALERMGTYGLIGLAFGDVVGLGAVPGTVHALVTASYSRAAEARADAFAHAQMDAAGLPPDALADMFRRMQARYGVEDAGLVGHFASHPDLTDRIAAAEHAHEGASGTALGTADWQALQRICGSVGGGGQMVQPTVRHPGGSK